MNNNKDYFFYKIKAILNSEFDYLADQIANIILKVEPLLPELEDLTKEDQANLISKEFDLILELVSNRILHRIEQNIEEKTWEVTSF